MQQPIISEKAASHLCALMIAVSSFTTLVVDGAEYMNSSWLCLCIGYLLSMPTVYLISKIANKPSVMRIVSIPCAAYFAYRAAAASRILINSVSYSNLENLPPLLLSAVMFGVCLYIIFKGGSGIGNALKIIFILSFLLLVIIAVSNLGYMNYRWLTPLLGTDTPAVLKGAVTTAGNVSAAAFVFTLCGRNTNSFKIPFISTLAGFITALFLCIYSEVMTPMQAASDMNRLRSIEIILANGRTSLGVQFPITVMWFIGYIAAMASYAFCSAAFVQNLIPKHNIRIAGIISILGAFLISNVGLAESGILNTVTLYSYPAALILSVIAFVAGRRKQLENQN